MSSRLAALSKSAAVATATVLGVAAILAAGRGAPAKGVVAAAGVYPEASGMATPEWCSPMNPAFVTARHLPWSSEPDDEPAIIALNDGPYREYDPASLGLMTIAEYRDVGTVYGLAFDPESRDLYASAFHRHGVPFGPGGPGAIYRYNLHSGLGRLVATLDAGAEHHDFGSGASDVEAIRYTGKTSLGDIDLSGDGALLFVANLHDGRIHVLSTDDMSHVGAFAHGAASEPWAPNARLFGLGHRDGWLYHGLVDSREDGALPGDLRGYVYRSRSDGSEMALVLEFGLDYARDPIWTGWDDAWWFDPLPDAVQPLLADIEFRPNGELIIGVASRGYPYEGFLGNGDILPTERIGGDRWRVVTQPEFYRDNIVPVPMRPPSLVLIEEPTIGSLAAFPEQDRIVATSLGETTAGGVRWYDNVSGTVNGPNDGIEYLIGDDARSVGDVEPMCANVVPPPPTPSPSATPTATPSMTPVPTTASPPATSTERPTASPTPTVRVTHEPDAVFLPASIKGHCLKPAAMDVVLVIDVSTSMTRNAGVGVSKIDAAVEAATQFSAFVLSDAPSGRRSRVALVGFNNTAWVEQDLTPHRRVVEPALRQLAPKMAEGTRLDLALQLGRETIARGTPGGDGQAVILLTDGLPNRVPPAADGTVETTVLLQAESLKELGAILFTIGFGEEEDLDAQLLREVATSSGHYRYAPDAAGLAAIYEELARKVRCGR